MDHAGHASDAGTDYRITSGGKAINFVAWDTPGANRPDNFDISEIENLTFVLPVTASAYVFIAVVGHFVLGDRISWERWLGIVVISLAVILAEETPSLTSKAEYREHSQ